MFLGEHSRMSKGRGSQAGNSQAHERELVWGWVSLDNTISQNKFFLPEKPEALQEGSSPGVSPVANRALQTATTTI